MKTTNIGLYAFRLTFGQSSPIGTQAASSYSNGISNTTAANSRSVARSATALALFGIALSSFGLKQLFNNKNRSHSALRKL